MVRNGITVLKKRSRDIEDDLIHPFCDYYAESKEFYFGMYDLGGHVTSKPMQLDVWRAARFVTGAVMSGKSRTDVRIPNRRKADPQRKADIERAAIGFVERHYAGYRIKSAERDNLGWDLVALKEGREPLRLEVKGLFGSDLQIGLTPREYGVLVSHMEGGMDNYRLCVVTKALSSRPHLVIFHHSPSWNGWIDDVSGRTLNPTIKPLTAAIISVR